MCKKSLEHSAIPASQASHQTSQDHIQNPKVLMCRDPYEGKMNENKNGNE
jgi:hypothetical protein